MKNKLKTRKAMLSRFKITGRKKVLKRPIHQDHFNAKCTGDQTRSKRKNKKLSAVNNKKIKRILANILL